MAEVHVLSHPLILDKLTRMRESSTPSSDFRRLLQEVTMLMAYGATEDLPLRMETVRTPITEASLPRLATTKIAIVPILRAGLAMVDPMLAAIPDAVVGVIGMERDEETHVAKSYYCKLPDPMDAYRAIVVDPMLATGGSSIMAVDELKSHGCTNISMMNLVAAPEGIEAFTKAHPDVDVYVAAIDERLNENAYIVPGLGDAGDRYFGTL